MVREVRFDEQTLSLITLVIAAALIALAIWLTVVHRSFSALRGRLRAIQGTGGQGLDEVLGKLSTRLDRANERLDALTTLQKELEALLRTGTIRNVGLVRFNPFPDAGGDQSFAIALLDAEGTGIVLSSLHARTDTRVFAKPVQTGRSRYPLSEEEQDAIRRALSPGERAM